MDYNRIIEKIADDITWEKIGIISLDSGVIWIGDPAYVLHRGDKGLAKELGKDWDDFLSTAENNKVGSAPYHYDHGKEGLGVFIDGFGGDGSFNVFVKKGGENNTVSEIKIVPVPKIE